MNTISNILAPTLGVMAAAGITKGLISLAATLGWCQTDSGTYMLLYALGDGFFYFLPILLGVTSARKFKCNEFVGAGIGAALVYPSMVNIGTTLEVAGTILAGTPFAMNYYNKFLGIPVVMPGSGYTSSVVPIILAVYVASKIEKACKKNFPEVITGIFTPLVTLVVSVILTYIVIGPVSTLICGCISAIITFLYKIPILGGIIAGALIGGGFGILVMFGLHWVVISLGLSTLAINGYDYMLACAVGPMIGMFQGIALCIASRNNKKVRDLAIPATISQICGIGEPLMYSILIPLKKPLYLNILGGCIGGAVIGLLQTKMYLFGGSGLFSFANFISPTSGLTDLIKYTIGVLAGGIFVFVAQLITYKDEDAKNLL
jgi:PTS system beta-glucosides-specific IIC component